MAMDMALLPVCSNKGREEDSRCECSTVVVRTHNVGNFGAGSCVHQALNHECSAFGSRDRHHESCLSFLPGATASTLGLKGTRTQDVPSVHGG